MLCTNLVVRTPKDGRGISQKQVLEQNLSSTDVHGRTSVERYTDVQLLNSLFQKAYGKVLQYMPLLKIFNVSERTRMSVYNCPTGYCWRQAKGLWKVFSKP